MQALLFDWLLPTALAHLAAATTYDTNWKFLHQVPQSSETVSGLLEEASSV